MTDYEYCESNHVRTIIDTTLPYSVKGFVFHDKDGDYCIVINGNHSIVQQHRTAQHELRHIRRGDLDNYDYVEYR